MDYVIAFTVSFVSIGVKAFQGRNFAHANYKLMVPTSVAITATELYIVALIAKGGYSVSMILAVGVGGGLGGVLAVYLHQKFVKGLSQ